MEASGLTPKHSQAQVDQLQRTRGGIPGLQTPQPKMPEIGLCEQHLNDHAAGLASELEQLNASIENIERELASARDHRSALVAGLDAINQGQVAPGEPDTG